MTYVRYAFMDSLQLAHLMWLERQLNRNIISVEMKIYIMMSKDMT